MKVKSGAKAAGNGKRRRWSASETLRIVIQGMEPGVEVSDLCRREGLSPAMYYQWKRTLIGAAERIFNKQQGKPSARKQPLVGAADPRVGRIILDVLLRMVLDGAVQGGLVRFHGQAIIGHGIDELLRDLCLAAHGINRHQGPGNVDAFLHFRIAVISLLLASTTTWPRLMRLWVAQPLAL